MGYHITNVILHCVVCYLYNRLCKIFLINENLSLIATILFTVHPIHTEAVTGVVGRAEILSSIFFLGSFILYYKSSSNIIKTNWKSLFYCGLCIVCAIFSKEQGITVAGICVIYEIFVVQKIQFRDVNSLIHFVILKKKSSTLLSKNSSILKSNNNLLKLYFEGFKRLLVLICLTCFLIILRVYIMGSQLPVFTRFDNPASVAPTPTRQLTFNYLMVLNLWLLLFPCNLCCDWTMGTIPLINNFKDIRILTIILMYAWIVTVLYSIFKIKNQQHKNVLIMGLSFLILPFLPASNLFFPVGFVVAERVLYMPSMGFCILIAYGYNILSSSFQKKIIVKIFLIALILIHIIKTHQRNYDWKTEYTIFMSGLKVNQNNAKLFNNVGHALESEERYNEALIFFQKAINVQSDDIGAYINVGRTYNNLKMFKDAELAFLKAKSLLPKAKPGESYQTRIAPNYLNVFLNLANLISKNSSRLEEADLLYRQAISMRSDYIQAYINRGDILMKLNRTKDAQENYEKALEYDKENSDINYNLGVVFLEQGRVSDALLYFNRALAINPDHYQALLSSSILLQETGEVKNRKIAKERLFKLLQKDESNENVYFNLGMLYVDENNTKEAELWFKKAISIKSNFRSALFNLALLLADSNRHLDAIPFLKQLINFHPNHVKGLILLGDIYVNTLKDLQNADKCYRKILKIDPNNIQALHNLCVVYVEFGKLVEALHCLEKAHKMAPTEEYIKRHLQIVKTRLNKQTTLGLTDLTKANKNNELKIKKGILKGN